MNPIVAAYDYKTRKVLHLEEFRHGDDAEAKWSELVREYPETHQEVVIGYAPSLKDWVRYYPQYAGYKAKGDEAE